MAGRHSYSRALRLIGQELDKRGIDIFELRHDGEEYLLQCGDPTPPYLALIQLRYSVNELKSLDHAAATKRSSGFKLVDFNGLAEILRALGRHVEKKEAELRGVSTLDSIGDGKKFRLEYEVLGGRVHVEELYETSIAAKAEQMYHERARIVGERAAPH
jgi:hypothetical protein